MKMQDKMEAVQNASPHSHGTKTDCHPPRAADSPPIRAILSPGIRAPATHKPPKGCIRRKPHQHWAGAEPERHDIFNMLRRGYIQ